MGYQNLSVYIRNDSAGTINIGSLSLDPAESVEIWDTVDYVNGILDNFIQVVDNIAVFNENISTSDLVLVVNTADQTPQNAFTQFQELWDVYKTLETQTLGFTILRLDGEATKGLSISHGDLSDLTTGDDHTQYLLADGSRAMSGNLDMDGNSIVNVGGIQADGYVTVRKNSGADIGTRARLNFIEGTNISLTIADDAVDEEIDITVTSTGAGSGDVVGPSSSTDEALVRFDGTTGKLVQNSNATLTDAGALSLTLGLTLGGNLDMGANNITNVGTVDGVDVSDHSSRHDPGGDDALTTAAPTDVGDANAEGSAGSFARSDHVHALGGTVGGDLSGSLPNPTVTDLTISSEEQGSVLYNNGSNWVQLSPGTDGYVLTTHGAGANPTWDEVVGGSGLSEVKDDTSPELGGNLQIGSYQVRGGGVPLLAHTSDPIDTLTIGSTTALAEMYIKAASRIYMVGQSDTTSASFDSAGAYFYQGIDLYNDDLDILAQRIVGNNNVLVDFTSSPEDRGYFGSTDLVQTHITGGTTVHVTCNTTTAMTFSSSGINLNVPLKGINGEALLEHVDDTNDLLKLGDVSNIYDVEIRASNSTKFKCGGETDTMVVTSSGLTMSQPIVMSNNPVQNGKYFSVDQVYAVNGGSPVSGNFSLDFSNGQMQSVTLNGNATVTSLSFPGEGIYSIEVTQDATGGRTLAWPATVLAPGGKSVGLVLSTTGSAKDLIALRYNGTNTFAVISKAFAA